MLSRSTAVRSPASPASSVGSDGYASDDQSALLLEDGAEARAWGRRATPQHETAQPATRTGSRAEILLILLVIVAVLVTLGTMHRWARPATPGPTPVSMRVWVMGSKPERLASSSAAIRQAFPSLDLSISSVPMVPMSDPRIQYRHRADTWSSLPREKRSAQPWEHPQPSSPENGTKAMRAISNALGWMDMWARAGADPTLGEDEWILMFEDDVALVPQPPEAGPTPFDYTPALLELFAQPAVQSDGIVYLGGCRPQWAPIHTPALSAQNQLIASSASGWLTSRRGVAWCTHAFAFTKRRARTLVSDQAAYLHTSITYASDMNLRLLFFATGHWPFIFGAERHSPIINDHMGIFYQDRAHHKSIIEQITPKNAQAPAPQPKPNTNTNTNDKDKDKDKDKDNKQNAKNTASGEQNAQTKDNAAAANKNSDVTKKNTQSDTAKQTQKPADKKQADPATTTAATAAAAPKPSPGPSRQGASASASSSSTTGAARRT